MIQNLNLPQFVTGAEVLDKLDYLKARLATLPDEVAATVAPERRAEVRATVQREVDKLNGEIDARTLKLFEESVATKN